MIRYELPFPNEDTMTEARTPRFVPFYGDDLVAVQQTDGTIFVVFARGCDAPALRSWSRPGDGRMDAAARIIKHVQGQVETVVGDLTTVHVRLGVLEGQLQPLAHHEVRRPISNRVKALGEVLTGTDPSKNHYQGIFGELYRRFGVSSYKLIRQDQYAGGAAVPRRLAGRREPLADRAAVVPAVGGPRRPRWPTEAYVPEPMGRAAYPACSGTGWSSVPDRLDRGSTRSVLPELPVVAAPGRGPRCHHLR